VDAHETARRFGPAENFDAKHFEPSRCRLPDEFSG
jgi:hypothetical protein